MPIAQLSPLEQQKRTREIEDMFKDFGLADEKTREHFRALRALGECHQHPEESIFIRIGSNSSLLQ